MFEFIENIKSYFYSVRLIKEKISIDIRIPSSWVFDHLLNDIITYRLQDNDDKVMLISFIAEYNENNLTLLYEFIMKVIQYNIEEEQKNLLLTQKIKELQELFEKESLDNLKKLNFNEK